MADGKSYVAVCMHACMLLPYRHIPVVRSAISSHIQIFHNNIILLLCNAFQPMWSSDLTSTSTIVMYTRMTAIVTQQNNCCQIKISVTDIKGLQCCKNIQQACIINGHKSVKIR